MTCRYTMVECSAPHLNCDTCPVKLGMTKGDVPLAAARTEIPDPRPYVRVGRDGTKPSIEIGIKGTF